MVAKAFDFLKQLQIPNNFRYERKFTLTAESRQEALYYIKNHSALFREIFHSRQINNIYFDTQVQQFYKDNEIGIDKRKKVRIRWYGDTFGDINQPKLEFKIKHGLVGDKWTFNLANFYLEPGNHLRQLQEIFQKSELPSPVLEQLQELQPSLLNTYQRTYFQSADRAYRLTLDEQMVFHKMGRSFNNFLVKREARRQFVLELKYALDADVRADLISDQFPFRMDKFSKYVNGIDLTQK